MHQAAVAGVTTVVPCNTIVASLAAKGQTFATIPIAQQVTLLETCGCVPTILTASDACCASLTSWFNAAVPLPRERPPCACS